MFRKISERFYLCIVTDIASEAGGVNGQVFKRGDGSIYFTLPTSRDNDFGPCGTETLGEGETNTGSTPGNDDNFIVKVLQDMFLQVCAFMFGGKPSATSMARTVRVCLLSYGLSVMVLRQICQYEGLFQECCTATTVLSIES